MAVLLCPLCSQPRFNNLESLRLSLVSAATQSISCPICDDVLMGLDKLTIHLFGHTLNQSPDNKGLPESLMLKSNETIADPCVSSKLEGNDQYPNQGTETCETYPTEITFSETSKYEGDKYLSDIGNAYDAKLFQEGEVKNDGLCTVNMEDLSFLTSWESSMKTRQESKVQSSVNEKQSDLSDYMSDLLNKKLPGLNFAFELDKSKEGEVEKSEMEKNQLKCGTCGFAFQNAVVLSMHQELVHPSEQEKKPNGDDLKPADIIPEFLDEGNKDTEKDKTSVTNESRKEEKEDAHIEMLPRYDCHLCSKSFKMKGNLLVHFRVAHLALQSSESLEIFNNPCSPKERTHSCPICKKSFKKEQHLSQHIKIHEGKQWQCETCSKHFTTKYFLKKHQRLHTGEMPYSCSTCKKTFTFQQSYHKHLLYHSDEKPHQCKQCGRSFKELSTLHNHQRIHSGEKPFACETCGKCFRQRVSYIVHQRIHTGVLPYQCTACKKKFRYKVSQRSHKCTSQPPGVVIRQPDLVQKILESNHILRQNLV